MNMQFAFCGANIISCVEKQIGINYTNMLELIREMSTFLFIALIQKHVYANTKCLYIIKDNNVMVPMQMWH